MSHPEDDSLSGSPSTLSDTVHPLFPSTQETDVTFQSSDGQRFHLRRKYLETHAGAFPSAEFETKGEIVHLSESAAALGILFQFLGPRNHPDLDDEPFKTIMDVAEAAEKYELYAAISVCQLQLRRHIPDHPLELFAYAAKHDHWKILNQVAPNLLHLPLIDVAESLPLGYLLPWIRYHHAWHQVFDTLLKYIEEIVPGTFMRKGLVKLCPECREKLLARVRELKGFGVAKVAGELQKPGSLLRVGEAEDESVCEAWCRSFQVQSKIRDDIGPAIDAKFQDCLKKKN